MDKNFNIDDEDLQAIAMQLGATARKVGEAMHAFGVALSDVVRVSFADFLNNPIIVETLQRQERKARHKRRYQRMMERRKQK